MKVFAPLLSLLAVFVLLAACGDVKTDPTYRDKAHDELYKNGSLVSSKGGFSLFGGDEKKAPDNVGIGVNAFLWHAALDTVSFLPIASADPVGGVILTDWYQAPETPTARIKLNIFIRDRALTANGVKVSVFRQEKNAKGEWSDATVSPSTPTALENEILTRARQIRIAQKHEAD